MRKEILILALSLSTKCIIFLNQHLHKPTSKFAIIKAFAEKLSDLFLLSEKCTCVLDNADRFLQQEDKAFLISFWKSNALEHPIMYFAKKYGDGSNTPPQRYSLANQKCPS